MAYQYAIEEVFWRHRIWPNGNPGPKPSLDAVVSPAQLEKKVEDYLNKSELVAAQRGPPITPGELQAEMQRMASHTKQPDVLRELFQALGNDPFVIAECLARPTLAGRFVSELKHHAEDGESATLKSDARTPRTPKDFVRKREDLMLFRDALGMRARPRVALELYPSVRRISLNARDEVGARNLDNAAYKLPEIFTPLDCADNTWTATSTVNAPDAREFHTAVWTGSEMIIWGGFSGTALNTGARYIPATDSWAVTAIVNAPASRSGPTAVWSGSEMIIWGGGGNGGLLSTGGRYNPASDSWITTSTANAPAARAAHTAVWTGGEMLIWGGRNESTWMNSGARYNPSGDTWTAMSTMNAPAARWEHKAMWTGSEMIVWGGTDQTNYLHTGGKYNPATDTWTATSLANVPPGRIAHGEIWTGSEMIVWGGVDESFNDTNTGGRYNPSTDSWIATNAGSGPSPRDSHSAVWTGREMIIWGGENQTGDFNTGGKYDAATDAWTATSTGNAPLARNSHTAVWSGSEMIVWGGLTDTGYLNTGGKYCAQPSTPIVQNTVSRRVHGTAGTFDIVLPLSGPAGIECRSGGLTGDYTIVVTFLANVSVNGNPQAAVTSGIGSIGTGGGSDGGTVTIAGNIVTIPLTNVTNGQAIQVTLNSVNGSTNITIPMRVLVGDANGNGAVNASDVALTKSRIGQPINSTTFRSDVNADGSINASDVSLVKSTVGTGLP